MELIYCYDEDSLELIGNATAAVRKYDTVPAVGDFLMARNDDTVSRDYWLVVRRIFSYKGGGTIDLLLSGITYKDLYAK